MKLLRLFTKPHQGATTSDRSSLLLQRGYGIKGDAHAQPGSPRHVLLVSQPVLEDFGLQPGQLGENLLVDGRVEDFTSGQVLQIGERARVRLTFRCEPCANLERLQPGLVKRIRQQRGFLGIVIADGAIAPGDELILTQQHFPPIPDDAKGRFWEFVRRIPPGKVVATPEVILALGVSRAYYRTLPILMKQPLGELPVHRIVRADGSLFAAHVTEQERQLATEGVQVRSGKVSPTDFWEVSRFHALDAE